MLAAVLDVLPSAVESSIQGLPEHRTYRPLVPSFLDFSVASPSCAAGLSQGPDDSARTLATVSGSSSFSTSMIISKLLCMIGAKKDLNAGRPYQSLGPISSSSSRCGVVQVLDALPPSA